MKFNLMSQASKFFFHEAPKFLRNYVTRDSYYYTQRFILRYIYNYVEIFSDLYKIIIM